jgi:hypothetical protein
MFLQKLMDALVKPGHDELLVDFFFPRDFAIAL